MTAGRAWLPLIILIVLFSGCEPEEGQPVGDPCDRGVAHEKKGDGAKAEADFAKAEELGYEGE